MSGTAGELNEGPLFRRIDRHGHLNDRALHRDSIGAIVKRAAEAAVLDPKVYAGHSLRGSLHAGLCQRRPRTRHYRQTGHKLETVRKYIRGRGLFRDNRAAKLGL
jgi:hypothetical protein